LRNSKSVAEKTTKLPRDSGVVRELLLGVVGHHWDRITDS